MSEGQPTFYRIDSSGFTFKEYLWGTKNPLTLFIAGIIKLLRINMGGSIDDPAVDSLRAFEIAESQLPPDIFEKFYPIALELFSLDFEAPIFHAIEDKLNFRQFIGRRIGIAMGLDLREFIAAFGLKRIHPNFIYSRFL